MIAYLGQKLYISMGVCFKITRNSSILRLRQKRCLEAQIGLKLKTIFQRSTMVSIEFAVYLARQLLQLLDEDQPVYQPPNPKNNPIRNPHYAITTATAPPPPRSASPIRPAQTAAPSGLTGTAPETEYASRCRPWPARAGNPQW